MATIVRATSELEEFARLRPDWDRLARREMRSFPEFADIHDYVINEGKAFRLIIAEDSRGIRAIACFVVARTVRGLWLGERKLFDVPVRKAVLKGAAFLGAPDAALAAMMLDHILTDPVVNFVNLGDVDRSSGLYAAAVKRRWTWTRNETDWRATRRMIVLPGDFRDYLASLRPSTRKAALRDQRLFAKLAPEFRVMTRPEDMRAFLLDAVRIGDRTYQAGNAFGIDLDPARLRTLEEKAAAGRLIAFLAYVDGQPCAFSWGEINYDTFYFLYTGFDPAYRRYCAGTAMLLHVIAHLIADRRCARFDFGIRDMDYKERFATHSIACAYIILGSVKQPLAACVVVLDRLIDAAKPMFLRWVGGEAGLNRIKQIMRK